MKLGSIDSQGHPCRGIRLSAKDEDGNEIGRVWLYVIWNNLHSRPYGYVEDLYVEEDARGLGVARELMRALLREADRQCCYKVIAGSRHERPHVHAFYEKLGFRDHGKEFRLDL